MKKTIHTTGLFGLIVAGGTSLAAQEAALTWEGSVEVGVESTVQADDPSAEVTEAYISADIAFEAAITDRISAFGGLTLETLTDPEVDRMFDDMGLYVSELGFRFAFGDTLVSVGKVSPVFAVAWDEATGFYGTSLAEDYELSEMVGVTVSAPVSTVGGTLSFAVFYADDTVLSQSIGNKRDRNSVADGGVANTGKLNNFSVQYAQEFGDTTAWIGARHLSAGVGGTFDETGIVAGASRDFGNGFNMIGEVVHLDNLGGAEGSGNYATVGGAYALDDWTFSANATLFDISSDTDSMIALGIDRSLTESVEVNLGVAQFDIGNLKSTAVGLAAVISF